MATTPTFVAAGTLVATATNAATIQPAPPNGAIGDFLLLVLERNDTTAAPTVTNWTAVATATGTNGSSSTGVYWRIATSATGTTDQPSAITFGSGTVVRAGVVLRYAGVDPFNPIHQANIVNVASTATTVNATNLTSTRDNTLAVFIATMIGARSTTNTTTNWSAGGGVTAFASQQTTAGNDETIGYGSKSFDVAGSYLSPGIIWTTNTTTGVGQGLLLGLNAIGPPPGQSTLDSRRPSAFLARVYRYPVYDAHAADDIMPLRTSRRAQVSWLQLEVPDAAAAATPLPPGQSTLDTTRPAAYRAKAYRYPVYDANQWNTLIPELLGQDALPAGDQAVALPPSAAERAQDYTHTQELIPVLVGQDAMTTGDQTFALPPSAAARARDYSLTESFPLTLLGQDAFPTGAQRTDLPPAGAARARDYSISAPLNLSLATIVQALPYGAQWLALPPQAPDRAPDYTHTAELIPNLVGQDALVTGQQFTALPPFGPLRARDYTWAPPISLNLATVVQVIPYGQQSTDSLPARAAARARDYTHTQELIPNLIGQDAMNAGSQLSGNAPAGPRRATDYTHTADLVPNLVGQDAMLVGAQSTALPPIAPLRARDYSFTPPINLSTLTTVVQQIPYGAQLTDSLPPRAAARARDYTHTAGLIPNLIGQDQLNAGQQSTALAPSPAPRRARDYSITESFPLTLIGQDAMAAGAQRTDLPPSAAPRARDYTFAPAINLSCLTTVVQPIPYGAQLTDSLPPRAAARARDYSVTDKYKTLLAGQDALVTGKQVYDLPPRTAPRGITLSDPGTNLTIIITGDVLPVGTQSTSLAPKRAARANDYTHLNRLPNLIGQDTIYGARGEAPSYDYPNPRAPQRARDYTWLQSMALYVFQQLPTGHSSQVTEGPPKGPLRARDYTHLDLTKQNLIGQDTMFGAPGQVPTYDWQLPTPMPARMKDYSFIEFANLGDIVERSIPGLHTLTVRPLHLHTLTIKAEFLHTLTVRAEFVHTLSVSVVPHRA